MNKNKKERLEYKLWELFYGDGSDDDSGLSWWELKRQNLELTGKDDSDLNHYISFEYNNRKNSIIQTIYEYLDCVYKNIETDENFAQKFCQFITYLMTKVEEDRNQNIVHYISRCVHNCVRGNQLTNKAKLTSSLVKLKKIAGELGLDIHNEANQEFLAEQLLQNYLESHTCSNATKKYNLYLKRIKLLAQLDKSGAESLDFADSEADTNKFDTKTGQNYDPKEDDSFIQSNNLNGTENSYRIMFQKIENWFQNKQDRKGKSTKEYLSALVTYSLIKTWHKQDALDQLFFDLMKEYSFTDLMLWAELQDCWANNKKLPKQQEIAARFERDSTGKQRGKDDASRALRGFKNLILN